MTTIVATFEPATASVVLTITPTSTVTAIYRSDANGAGIAVRVLTGQLPAAGALVVRDFEAAAGLVAYAVLDASVGAAASVVVSLAGPRLAAALFPQALSLPGLVTGYVAGYPTATTVHEIINSPDAIPTLGPLRSRAGTLDLWLESYAAVLELLAVYDVAEVVFLRQSDYAGLDLYHVAAGSIDVKPADVAGRWLVTVPYREVRRPLEDLRGTLGWTWNDVLAGYGTWTQLERSYPTWNDVQIGPL